MALTRKYLKAMGIEDEKIDQIIEAHTETVEGLKTEITNAKTNAESGTQKIADLEKLVEELKNTAAANEGKNPWKVKYDALKDEFEGYKTEEQKKVTKAAKENAYKTLLKETGVSEKRIASVMKVTNIDSLEIGEDGKFKDQDNLVKNIKDEWSDFIATQDTKGADVSTPPTNNGGDVSGDHSAAKRIAEQRAMLYGEVK